MHCRGWMGPRCPARGWHSPSGCWGGEHGVQNPALLQHTGPSAWHHHRPSPGDRRWLGQEGTGDTSVLLWHRQNSGNQTPRADAWCRGPAAPLKRSTLGWGEPGHAVLTAPTRGPGPGAPKSAQDPLPTTTTTTIRSRGCSAGPAGSTLGCSPFNPSARAHQIAD